MQDKGLLNC